MVGKMIGRYKMQSELGAGGMGVVYSAIDVGTNLPAAVKVLSPAALADPERRRRFLLESKTMAKLRHPNIVAVHEAGQVDLDGQKIQYIAMELVEGRTLEKMIAGNSMSVSETLSIAAQIAAALESAHAAGVVHRDLKPSNVMVTGAGGVKVLDFGLAKWTQPQFVDFEAETASFQQSLTSDGSIVGTVSYMSPEQAQGKPVDTRSDVLSFGALLYEMLAGRRAFSEETRVATVSAVLLKEPAPLSISMPESLRDLVQRCLRKEPERRWQTMADLRVTLDDVVAEMARPPMVASGRRWILGTAAGLAAGLAIGPRVFRPEPVQLKRLTFRRGDVLGARFASGGTVVYTAAWDTDPPRVFVASPGVPEARPIDLPPAVLAAVSPTDELLVLLGSGGGVDTGTLARVPLAGGTPRELSDEATGADWSPRGEVCVVRRFNGRFRLEYPPNTLIAEMDRAPGYNPRVSPDGSRVAILESDANTGDYGVSVFTGSRREVWSRGWRVIGGIEWSPSGSEVWMMGVRPGGDPSILAVSSTGTERVVYRVPGLLHLMAVTPTGNALVASSMSRLGILCQSPFSERLRDLAWLDGSRAYDLSDDGRMLLFAELGSGEGRNAALYVRKTDGSPAVKLGLGNRPTLSRDGKWVACIRWVGDRTQVALLPTGTGTERLLDGAGLRHEAVEPFDGGQRVLIAASEESTRPVRSYVQDANGRPTPVTPLGVRALRISPDGAAVVTLESGRITLRRLDASPPRAIADARAGEGVARWSSDGRHLFLARSDLGQRVVEIVRMEVATGRREPWKHLEPPESGQVLWGSPSLSGDGKYFAMSFRRDSSDLYLAKGLR